MTKNTRISALALIVGMALVLGACGSKGGGSEAAGSIANVTFTSEPMAEVWIDGKASGTTPLALALSAGAHKIAMKRRGFHDIVQTLDLEAGKDVTVNGALPVSGSDAPAFRRLLARVDTEYVPFDKATTHRGAGDVVTLYYPSGDVRRSGLSTYRVEVSGDYDAEGFIEFRKGRKILYREKFEPEAYVTERALPAEVLEAARNGAKLSWGLSYDSKRRKKSEVQADFKVIGKSREHKIARRIDRTMNRKAARSASPLLQEMLQIRLLGDQRLYSEALMRSLAVLNTWEDTALPYSNMAAALQRLKLKDSSLYKFVAGQLLGAGGKRFLPGGSRYLRPNEARQGKGGGALDGGSAQRGSAGRRSRLPSIAVAPKSKSAGDSGGMKPQGFGVTPTDQGNASDGPDAPSAAGDAGSADAGLQGEPLADASERALKRMRRDAEEAELRAADAEQAEKDLLALDDELEHKTTEIDEANRVLEAAAAALEEAQKDADAVTSTGTATPTEIAAAEAVVAAARQARDAADQEADALRREVSEMEIGRAAAERTLREVLKETGPSEAAGQEAARLRELADRAERRSNKSDEPQTDGTQGPGLDDGTSADLGPNGEPGDVPTPGAHNRGVVLDLRGAEENEQAAAADLDAATNMLNEAQKAFDQLSEVSMPAAEKDRDDKQIAHDDLVAAGAAQAQIDAAKAAVDAADAAALQQRADLDQAGLNADAAASDAARAQIELERAHAAVERTRQDATEPQDVPNNNVK